jgi:8-oxo-dGTP pyrophosphatase MutT (NUDIX family)
MSELEQLGSNQAPAVPVGRGRQIIPRPPVWSFGPGPAWPIGAAPSLANVLASIPVTSRPLLPSFSDALHSAVLVLLTDAGDGPEVLLTRRSWEMRNHRGEMSFPGGRMDPGESARDTALREALEEVGLDPAVVTVHGELDHLNTVVSRSYIVPKVATVDARLDLRGQTNEVERVLWVPLTEFTREGVYRTERWGEPPLERLLHFFELEDETVWGATARILSDLLSRSVV